MFKKNTGKQLGKIIKKTLDIQGLAIITGPMLYKSHSDLYPFFTGYKAEQLPNMDAYLIYKPEEDK